MAQELKQGETLTPSTAGPLARALERWFAASARDLPWRRSADPYAIWVSEVMLQQTQVATVIPYYERFLARFPTLATLAEASEEEVLAAWAGLGYYRRARLLHAGVREVVARYGGKLPLARDARRTLPGVGPYTNGAIGSIAFEAREAVVDGNVARVLSRLCGLPAPLGSRASTEALWAVATQLVEEATQPSALNQGLMELGALVCTKSKPRCYACPWRESCCAHARGLTDKLPRAKPKTPQATVALLAYVLETQCGQMLLEQSTGSLFRGLWSPPLRTEPDPTLEASTVALQEAGRVTHVLTHRRLKVRVLRGRIRPDMGVNASVQVGLCPLSEASITSVSGSKQNATGPMQGLQPSVPAPQALVALAEFESVPMSRLALKLLEVPWRRDDAPLGRALG